MRIIAGRFRGRRLAGVRGRMRPTADRVREAIFNILGPGLEEVRVLDLFAGTGALGIEALSRGARQAVFVEHDSTALQVLRKNLASCGLGAATQVLPLPVPRALKQLAVQAQRFELIFLDPPYGKGLAAQSLELLAQRPLLRAGGRVVVEHGVHDLVPEHRGSLIQVDQRRYGDTRVSFYLSFRAGDVNQAADKEYSY
ncbi:MAG: 16S rRNA (guanine(966)-N(2))-methyltransferase RsmD [Desulfobacca sp.]|nr:16S rRNA (guanine(966)-N(2))-methyltransferase RsmD [Desulfobacca sp.]